MPPFTGLLLRVTHGPRAKSTAWPVSTPFTNASMKICFEAPLRTTAGRAFSAGWSQPNLSLRRAAPSQTGRPTRYMATSSERATPRSRSSTTWIGFGTAGLRELSITDFQFDAQYQQAVESKQVAEQRALTATNDLARIKVEAQQAEAKAAQSSIWAKSRRPLGADQRWSFTRLASLGSNDS